MNLSKFCSYYLAFRYQPIGKSQVGTIAVKTAGDIDLAIKEQLNKYDKSTLGLLLSGGMDSGILASYLSGCNAYTFRDSTGLYDDEINRAKKYCDKYNLKLNYVDISFDLIESVIDNIMDYRGEPVHSIEPQIYLAANQAKKDGVKCMIIGDAADFVFCGFDKVFSQDGEYEAGKKRYIYVDPNDVLVEPYDLDSIFKTFKKDNYLDMENLMLNTLGPEESYISYKDAFDCAGLDHFDPYKNICRGTDLDYQRIRNGESKYLIRELYKIKYPEFDIPEKIPMPRPVDNYFKNYTGPTNNVFKKFDIHKMTGNQKGLIGCLDRWLNRCNIL